MAQNPPTQMMQVPPPPAVRKTVPRLNEPTGATVRAIATDFESWKQQFGAWLKGSEWDLKKQLELGGTQWVPPAWPDAVTYAPNLSEHLMLVQFAKALDEVKEALGKHMLVWIYNANQK